MKQQGGKPGVTMIELLLFVAIFAIVGVAILPILFSSTEHRLLQQTIAIVEQNGAFTLQTIALNIRQSERILVPPAGQTGSVIALQTASGGMNPTIIGISSGSLVVVRRLTRQILSSTQVAIQNFTVRNTSVSATRQSAQVSFQVIRTIRLQAPHTYAQRFETVVTIPPDDRTTSEGCMCTAPSCTENDIYSWQVCFAGICTDATTPMDCP